jgi:hypothetical protein
MADTEPIQRMEHDIQKHIMYCLKHKLHSLLENSLMERVMQYFKEKVKFLMITILVRREKSAI